MGRLDGKVAVITGAGGGMGREAALLFSEEGAQVCVADVNADAAEQTARDARDAFAVQVDVADQDSVRAMYDRRSSDTAASTSSTTTPASRPGTTRPSSRPSLDAWDGSRP